jgi:hypothetical protein
MCDAGDPSPLPHPSTMEVRVHDGTHDVSGDGAPRGASDWSCFLASETEEDHHRVAPTRKRRRPST